LFTKHAKQAGETDFSFIEWQGHDFSFRGMSGREDAILSGMGHLLSFSGTDTIPAILAAQKYYGAKLSVGGSVPATEHSVMCAGSKDGELETFRHLIEDVYPNGIVSIVSDTWDLWKVLTDYVPTLRDKILARDGKVVIRPDSGDPVNIICGIPALNGSTTTPAQEGTLRLLAHAVGVDGNRAGLPLINKMGAIYGDSITLQRADQILSRTVNELKLSPYNVVFGIGSYTYEYVTRDTFGFAMKATAIRRNGEVEPIFKKPVTDSGTKNSHKGIPLVYRTEESTEDKPTYVVVDGGTTPAMLSNCAFRRTYANGELLIDETFDAIRKRVRA
jgi:nicotinamide phosphoribosyltransferase